MLDWLAENVGRPVYEADDPTGVRRWAEDELWGLHSGSYSHEGSSRIDYGRATYDVGVARPVSRMTVGVGIVLALAVGAAVALARKG